MPGWSHRRRIALSSAVFFLLMTGCHPAMSAQANNRIEPPAPTREVPLKFGGHNFAVPVFNTLSCSVVYDNHEFAQLYIDKPSGPPPSSDNKNNWSASYAGIHNFPPPAEVKWTSLDGVKHEARVDIGEIFKDQLIWHKVPKADMADFYRGPFAGDPDIYLEVNDHTINVYTSMLIPTRTEQIPGNKYSFGRDDLFLAWTHTY
jgi:hypothetical protein